MSLGGAATRSDVAAALGEYGEYLVQRPTDRDRVIREVGAGVDVWRAAAERAGIQEAEIRWLRGTFEGRLVVRV